MMQAMGRLWVVLALAGAWAVLGACRSSTPPPARQVTPLVTRDVPAVLRGTVGSEATLRNNDPVLVSGWGLVVGLRGTGGGVLPERVAATMERELGLRGITRGSPHTQGTPLEGLSPRELLRSRDTAVVVVFGAIIPGAPEGATFDVYVSPVSQSPDVSLEGGTLWTTDLRLGPPTPFEGGIKTTQIGIARGPVFINPFSAPGQGPTRRQGRVLGGGMVTRSLDLQLVLDNESHSRARAIAEAINDRFGRQAGERDDVVARGRTARMIEINVPAAYRDRADDFLNLITAIQIQQGFPQEFAKRYADALKTDPFLANELSWALEALPQRAALPFIRDLYEFGDAGPRLAALRAGAGLNDPLAVPHLQRLIAEAPSSTVRAEAIRLLGRITSSPAVDLALREQLSARELSVRVSAYEALAGRAEIVNARRLAAAQRSMPPTVRIADPGRIIDARATLAMPGDTVHGVRRLVLGGKFLLDVVEEGEPLVYVAQQGRPRVVLFGPRPTLGRPLTFSMWGDRLMIVGDDGDSEVRVMYRAPDRVLDTGETLPGVTVTARAPADLEGLVQFMVRRPTPEDPRPGLDLSYSDVVGVLYELHRAGALEGSFAVEEDLLQARLLAATEQTTATARPETPADVERQLRVMEPVRDEVGGRRPDAQREPLVVPLPPVQAPRR